MKMRFLFFTLSIIALTCPCSFGFHTGHKTIYSTDQISILPWSFIVKDNPLNISYMVSFPKASGVVTLMIFKSLQKEDVKVANCSIAYRISYWHETLFLSNRYCRDEELQQKIRCDGTIEFIDYSYVSYVFALSSCQPMGLKDTTYDLMTDVASTVTPTKFCSVYVLLCVVTMRLLY